MYKKNYLKRGTNEVKFGARFVFYALIIVLNGFDWISSSGLRQASRYPLSSRTR